jgi:hypothetical protein
LGWLESNHSGAVGGGGVRRHEGEIGSFELGSVMKKGGKCLSQQ